MKIHRVVLDEISDNMASLFGSETFGCINTTGKITNVFYVIRFTSETYTLQDNTTIDGNIITAGELVVKSQYIVYIQLDTNFYWYQHPKHHVIILTTRTIIHPRLEFNAITDIHGIPKGVCNSTKAKKPYQYIICV